MEPLSGAGAPGRQTGVTARRVLHRGRKFDFELVTARLPSGREVTREVVRHPGAVVIVPRLPDGRLAMIRVHRIALGGASLEFPAGTLEPGEAPEACAARELVEEAGCRAARLVPMGWFHTSPGLSDERMHAFFADGLEPVGQALEEDESIVVEPVTVPDVLERLERGAFADGKSMLALLLALRRGLLDYDRAHGGTGAPGGG